MRTLVLTRGAMGVGKSTWIKENGLEQYTLSADKIRLLFQSPVLDEEGKESITMKNDKRVWQFLLKLLEERMMRGEFTVIDATHIKPSSMVQYKKLAKEYRYRVYVVDFTDVPVEVALENNKIREVYKQVPEMVIRNAYSRIEYLEPQGWITVLKPDELLEEIHIRPLDFSRWSKIHHIGDVHGCYTALMTYLKDGLKDDELYIFLGDFCDRGVENYEVLNFLFEIQDKKNVIFLEGNHEIHLWKWANNENVRSREFNFHTQKELVLKTGNVEEWKKKTRMFYRRLRQLALYTYSEKKVLVTHAGITNMPLCPEFIATAQYIQGVGKYETPVNETFFNNTYENDYQIHGHRNIQNYPVQVNARTFNLEGRVEMGGNLRVVTLSRNGFETHEIKNEVVSGRFSPSGEPKTLSPDASNRDLIESLRNNKNIKENAFGSISSFNFKNNVFYDKLWDEQTIKARGLFFNTETGDIVARSYNKFFNINERRETTINSLKNRFRFPVSAYDKVNGYLGMVGYDAQSDQLVIASKSSLVSEYAEHIKKMFHMTFNDNQVAEIKEYLKKNNATFVFEVVDPDFDPHIIEYSTKFLTLLDIVYRDANYHKADYDTVVKVAEKFNVRYKRLIATYQDWESFYAFFKQAMSDKDELKYVSEGVVLEDSVGFMTKLKYPYYNFWKQMRSVKDQVVRDVSKVNLSNFYTPLHNHVFAFLRSYNKEELQTKNIITLRREFYKSDYANK